MSFWEATTGVTKTKEITETRTESAKINTLSLPSIALSELSAANNEPVDHFDSPEDLAPLVNSTPSRDSFGDRERTEHRYKKAVKWLEESFKLHGENWEPFVVPDFSNISENDSLPQLRQEIKKILDARSSSIKDRKFWS